MMRLLPVRSAPTRLMKSSIRRWWVASSSVPVTTWSTAATDRRAISARSSSPTRSRAAAMSATDLASRSATSDSMRARPSVRTDSACASASAMIRARSAAMSPLAWRICAASAVAAALSAAESSSSFCTLAVRAFIAFLICGQAYFHSGRR